MYAPTTRFSQPDARQQFDAAAARHLFQIGEQAHHFQSGQAIVSDEAFRQITDAAPHLSEVATVDAHVVHADLAGGRRGQSQHQFEQRAFARAIEADQAEHFALSDRQVDAVQRMDVAIPFADIGYLDHGRRLLHVRHWRSGRSLLIYHSNASNPGAKAACADACRRCWGRARRETDAPRSAVSVSMDSIAAA